MLVWWPFKGVSQLSYKSDSYKPLVHWALFSFSSSLSDEGFRVNGMHGTPSGSNVLNVIGRRTTFRTMYWSPFNTSILL